MKLYLKKPLAISVRKSVLLVFLVKKAIWIFNLNFLLRRPFIDPTTYKFTFIICYKLTMASQTGRRKKEKKIPFPIFVFSPSKSFHAMTVASEKHSSSIKILSNKNNRKKPFTNYYLSFKFATIFANFLSSHSPTSTFGVHNVIKNDRST